MSDHPTLVFLHGVGDGNPEGNWKRILNESLTRLGYPTIDEVEVIAPIYERFLETDEVAPGVRHHRTGEPPEGRGRMGKLPVPHTASIQDERR